MSHGNNPVCRADSSGCCYYNAKGEWCHDNWEYLGGYERKPDPKTFEELSVLNGGIITTYKDTIFIKSLLRDDAFSYGVVWFGTDIQATNSGIQTVRHEYGHTRQLDELGVVKYTCFVVVPSLIGFNLYNQGKLNTHYYSLPWEYEADVLGNVRGRKYNSDVQQTYYLYKFFISLLEGDGGDPKYACKLNS